MILISGMSKLSFLSLNLILFLELKLVLIPFNVILGTSISGDLFSISILKSQFNGGAFLFLFKSKFSISGVISFFFIFKGIIL